MLFRQANRLQLIRRKTMSNEIKNQIAVELSDLELDTVAGGVLSLDSGSLSEFTKQTLLVQNSTTATGAGAQNVQTIGAQDTSTLSDGFLNVAF
jgi:hypothetical protein